LYDWIEYFKNNKTLLSEKSIQYHLNQNFAGHRDQYPINWKHDDDQTVQAIKFLECTTGSIYNMAERNVFKFENIKKFRDLDHE
jgi:hypothetical protein